jgi:hypothetical protein
MTAISGGPDALRVYSDAFEHKPTGKLASARTAVVQAPYRPGRRPEQTPHVTRHMARMRKPRGQRNLREGYTIFLQKSFRPLHAALNDVAMHRQAN